MLGTIKSSTEISYIFSHGNRYNASVITLIVLRTDEQHGRNGRVTFIAGKKNGNAVWRNAAKRRMRAIYHELKGPWSGFDIIFLANKKTTRVPYSTVLSACKKVIDSLPRESKNA